MRGSWVAKRMGWPQERHFLFRWAKQGIYNYNTTLYPLLSIHILWVSKFIESRGKLFEEKKENEKRMKNLKGADHLQLRLRSRYVVVVKIRILSSMAYNGRFFASIINYDEYA